MSATVTPRRPADRRRPARPAVALAGVMGLEAVTLAVFATLHLSGALRIGSSGQPSYGAGVAEALICVALTAGAYGLVRSPAGRGRRAALAAVLFASFGFLVGLSFTLGSGDAIDLVYHLAMLPALAATAIVIARRVPANNCPV